ncbi:MAG: hypothetical protein ABH896_01055, partial [Candidatus Jacksonbacteria bacterium]
LKNQKAIASLSGILIGAVVLLVLTNIATVYYLISRNQKNLAEVQNIDSSEQIIDLESEAPDLSTGPFLPDQQNQPDQPTEKLTEQPQNLTAGEILIDWYEWPAEVSAWDIFNYGLVEQAIDAYNNKEENQYNKLTVSPEEFVKKFSIYEAGIISQGAFAGDKFYVITAMPDGPSFHDPLYRVIVDQEKAIIISKYSDKLWSGAIEKYLFSENSKITIANLEPAQEIAIPNSNLKLIKSNNEPFILWQKLVDPEKVFMYNGQDYVYKDKIRNCFIVRANDGTARDYNFDLKFLGKKSETEFYGSIPYILDIVWLDGTKNQEEYVYAPTGRCGGYGCYNYASYISDLSDLEKIGSTTKSNDWRI